MRSFLMICLLLSALSCGGKAAPDAAPGAVAPDASPDQATIAPEDVGKLGVIGGDDMERGNLFGAEIEGGGFGGLGVEVDSGPDQP